MKNLMPTPATIILIGSSLAVFGSLVAALGVYLGSLQETKESKHLLASVTGGDSHPQIILSQHDGSFTISVKGNYPLYEVRGQIFDLESFNEALAKKTVPLTPVPKAQYFDLGTLSSAYAVYLINQYTKQPVLLNNFEPRVSYRLKAQIFTRHHTFNFFLALEPNPKIDGTWLQAWQVHKDSEEKPIDQMIPEGFPKDATGNVDFFP